jgi:predicted nucleic acid-binding protein
LASAKLWAYQQVLKHASLMLVVSEHDTSYLHYHFPENEVVYLPSFHANEEIESITGKGNYALYNGNIEVPENAHAVKFLIKEVFNGLNKKLVVAGMNPPDHIQKLASEYPNIEIVANPDDEQMFKLIKEAQVNILVTFQATGLKLKLLNTLFKGRFCLVNSKMLNGTGLDKLCLVGDTTGELKQLLNNAFKTEFLETEVAERKEILAERYSNDKNADRLIQLVFDEFSL